MALQTNEEFYRRWRTATWTTAFRATGIVNLLVGTAIAFAIWKWPRADAPPILRWMVPVVALTWFFVWRGVRSAFELFREVDQRREQAEDELREKRDCQGIADYLTEQYHYGVHNLLHQPPTTEEELSQWNQWVGNWNEAISKRMEALGCSRQDIELFRTIKVDVLPSSARDPIAINVGLHQARVDRVFVISRKYAERAEDIRKRCPEK